MKRSFVFLFAFMSAACGDEQLHPLVPERQHDELPDDGTSTSYSRKLDRDDAIEFDDDSMVISKARTDEDDDSESSDDSDSDSDSSDDSDSDSSDGEDVEYGPPETAPPLPDAGTAEEPPPDEPDAGMPADDVPPPTGQEPPVSEPDAGSEPLETVPPLPTTLIVAVSPDATCWEYMEGNNPDRVALLDFRAEQDMTVDAIAVTVAGHTTSFYEDVCLTQCGGDCGLCADPVTTDLATYLYLCRLLDATTGAQVAGYRLVGSGNRFEYSGLAWTFAAGQSRTLEMRCAFRALNDIVRTADYTFSIAAASDLHATDAAGNEIFPEDASVTAGPFPHVTVDYWSPHG